MTTSDSSRLIEAWVQGWSSPNGLEKLFSLFTDDCVYEDLGTGTLTRGKEDLTPLSVPMHLDTRSLETTRQRKGESQATKSTQTELASG